jgi:NAD(P)-dependent dehydrogenase (short-subunit alcohol dehydrogenase family)
MDDYQHLSRSVAGRRVIITGAASGMGRATVGARKAGDAAICGNCDLGCQARGRALEASRQLPD